MDARTSSGHGGLIEKVSRWIANQRAMAADRAALTCCAEVEVERLAHDVGLTSSSELLDLIGKGPDSANLLHEMAKVLDIPLEAVRRAEPATVRDLEACCSHCSTKGRCVRELQEGTARDNYAEFCPNAQTLDSLRY